MSERKLVRRAPRFAPAGLRSRFKHPARFSAEEESMIAEAVATRLVTCPRGPDDLDSTFSFAPDGTKATPGEDEEPA